MKHPEPALTKAEAEADFVKYSIAANAGDVDAQNTLGCMYAEGQGVEKNILQAFRWIKKAAEGGNVVAMANLGGLYLHGPVSERNEQAAFKWFLESANQGDIHGAVCAGILLQEGRGVARNDARAAFWLKPAADAGIPEAQYVLGQMLFFGRGIAQNRPLAMQLLEKAAAQGVSAAMGVLGEIFEKGLMEGVPENPETATSFYRRAAELGEPKAEFDYAMMLYEGRGVDRNQEEALIWFQRAARHEDPAAEFNLGCKYLEGLDLDKSDRRAAAYFARSAEHWLETGKHDVPGSVAQKGIADAKRKLQYMGFRGGALWRLAVIDKNIPKLSLFLKEERELFWQLFRKHHEGKIAESDLLRDVYFGLLEHEKDHLHSHILDRLVFLFLQTKRAGELLSFFRPDLCWLMGVNFRELDAGGLEQYVFELHAQWLSLKLAAEKSLLPAGMDPKIRQILCKMAKVMNSPRLSLACRQIILDMLFSVLFEDVYEVKAGFSVLKLPEIMDLFNLYSLQQAGSFLYSDDRLAQMAECLKERGIIRKMNKENSPVPAESVKDLIIESRNRRQQEWNGLLEVAHKNDLDPDIEYCAEQFEKIFPEYQALSDYLRTVAKASRPEYNSWSGFFSGLLGGHPKGVKSAAVTKLMNCMMAEKNSSLVRETVTFSRTEKHALAHGKLHGLVEKFGLERYLDLGATLLRVSQ